MSNNAADKEPHCPSIILKCSLEFCVAFICTYCYKPDVWAEHETCYFNDIDAFQKIHSEHGLQRMARSKKGMIEQSRLGNEKC